MNDAPYNLPDDVLIYVIAFLPVPDIILLRQSPRTSIGRVALDGGSCSCIWTTDGGCTKIRSFDIDFRPVTLTGDIVALSDNFSKTLIYNWKNNEQAYLDEGGDMQYDHCIQIVFTSPNILVIVHAPSTCTLHTLPTWANTLSHCLPLLRLGRWHQCNTNLHPHPFESDNPWTSELNSKISSWHGALRCTDVILGKRGTAVWIRPHDRAMVSHWEEHDGCETLMAAIFPSPA
ncbi:uncharacterized protein EV420DRAFT_1649260 [Desarmillaria tabescens]|uniref:F-box domain-containing protein n=1 Tax=Armillaria tabescens TaxID=1929756 RepID=A0AA39JIL4_ARMTA|nr:uncharacterized protein EV420DRAFT_1649260 [Desarmillaria tabescens]KAK0443451.1 hypothetical protein EV420DRAFT_1649260 [Desarmillaria tabescens]